jgi:hypothetical protein
MKYEVYSGDCSYYCAATIESDRLPEGDTPARKAWIGVIIDRIEADQAPFASWAGKTPRKAAPVFGDCFNLIRRACTKPAVDVLKLLDAAIAQVIIGNADAHGKNYSLVYREAGIEFSPLYDLLCTVAYPELSPKFAMKIAKRATLEDMRPGDWDKFAIEAGLGAPFVRRRVKELPAMAEERAASIAAGLAASAKRGCLNGWQTIAIARSTHNDGLNGSPTFRSRHRQRSRRSTNLRYPATACYGLNSETNGSNGIFEALEYRGKTPGNGGLGDSQGTQFLIPFGHGRIIP